MQKLVLSACLSLFAVMLPSLAFAADPVPCEKSYSEAKAAMGTAKLTDANKAKVADLVAKGLERCKADDDQGADDLLAQAMTLMSKQ